MTLSNLRAFITAQRALCDGIVPGEGSYLYDHTGAHGHRIDVDLLADDTIVAGGISWISVAELDFIAAARTSLPQALDALERLLTVVEASVAYRQGARALDRELATKPEEDTLNMASYYQAAKVWRETVDAFIEDQL